MTRTSLQFHAAAHEIVGWAESWAAEHQLNVVVERFFPETRCIATDGDGITKAIDQLDGVWNRLWLSREALEIEASSNPPFCDDPETLVLHFGGAKPEEVRESALAAVSTESATLRTWRKIIKSAKSNLRKGAWVVNPVSGARQRQENHYFTKGALEASRNGVKMLAAAGWNQFELDGAGTA